MEKQPRFLEYGHKVIIKAIITSK